MDILLYTHTVQMFEVRKTFSKGNVLFYSAKRMDHWLKRQ